MLNNGIGAGKANTEYLVAVAAASKASNTCSSRCSVVPATNCLSYCKVYDGSACPTIPTSSGAAPRPFTNNYADWYNLQFLS